MDKASRALALAEENAQNIATLARRCISMTTAVGSTVDGKTSFGHVSAGATVIVVFTGASIALLSGTRQIANGYSPLIATTTDGELKLNSVRDNATAFIFK